MGGMIIHIVCWGMGGVICQADVWKWMQNERRVAEELRISKYIFERGRPWKMIMINDYLIVDLKDNGPDYGKGLGNDGGGYYGIM